MVTINLSVRNDFSYYKQSAMYILTVLLPLIVSVWGEISLVDVREVGHELKYLADRWNAEFGDGRSGEILKSHLDAVLDTKPDQYNALCDPCVVSSYQ